jgi:hypothetical protein
VRWAAGRVPFGHSNLIPVRLYRIDRSNGVTTISLVGTAGCAIALTAKPIPAMREVDGEETEVHVFFIFGNYMQEVCRRMITRYAMRAL